jgi:hypothetical protein
LKFIQKLIVLKEKWHGMRISLVWTRGELINRNNGKKHKSPSKIERDNRRSIE